MVGFVIVSHSRTLADGVVELTSMMADGVPIRAAGGLDDEMKALLDAHADTIAFKA